MEKNERDKQADATRAHLIEVGTQLFGANGFAAVPAEQIVKEAGLTRGALYHHFPDGKPELFAAVAESILQATAKTIAQVNAPPTWDRVTAMLAAFLQESTRQPYQKIVLQDAPFVIGAEAWRQTEHTHLVSLIEGNLEALIQVGILKPVPTKATAALIFGACCEATQHIAAAKNSEQAYQETAQSLETLLSGLRT